MEIFAVHKPVSLPENGQSQQNTFQTEFCKLSQDTEDTKNSYTVVFVKSVQLKYAPCAVQMQFEGTP